MRSRNIHVESNPHVVKNILRILVRFSYTLASSIPKCQEESAVFLDATFFDSVILLKLPSIEE